MRLSIAGISRTSHFTTADHLEILASGRREGACLYCNPVLVTLTPFPNSHLNLYFLRAADHSGTEAIMST